MPPLRDWRDSREMLERQQYLPSRAFLALQSANGALEYGDLRVGVAVGLEFGADLFLEIRGVAYFFDKNFEKTFGRQEGLTLQRVERLVAHRHVGGADVQHDVVVAVGADPFEPQALFVHGDPPKAGTL